MFDVMSLISIIKIRSDSFARLQFWQNSLMIKQAFRRVFICCIFLLLRTGSQKHYIRIEKTMH